MTLWKYFEIEFLIPWNIAGHSAFTNEDVAKSLDISTADASSMIQAYQEAMLNPNLDTWLVMAREGRTRNAVWHIGQNMKDLRRTAHQFGSDVENRIMDYMTPYLELISQKSPRARKRAAQIQVKLGRLLQQLEDLAAE